MSKQPTLESALATLVFYKAADRVRQESSEVLASLLDTEPRADALARMNACLPAPVGLLPIRTLIARDLIARGGLSSPGH